MKSYNFKLNKFAQLIAAGTFALAFSAQAATDVVTTASVEVDGTITVNKLADLNFGRIVATFDGTENINEGGQSTLRISANPNAAEIATVTLKANSSITKLTDGSPASFEVVGAAPNTSLTISVFQSDGTTAINAGAPLILGDPSAGGSDHVFALESFNFWYLTHDNNFTSDTDANGNLDFNVGGTLSTSNYQNAGAASDPYQDASYTAQFIVRVDY